MAEKIMKASISASGKLIFRQCQKFKIHSILGKMENIWPFLGVGVQTLITCLFILLWEKKFKGKRSPHKYNVDIAARA